VAAVGALSLVGAGSVSVAAHEGGGSLLEFDSMTAVGSPPTVERGIPGGGRPWQIASGSGEVSRKGKVSVEVTGLILTTGTNPIANFQAVVSCITRNGIVNVKTASFAATSTGDSTIDDSVSLPRHCKNPEVFVGFTNPANNTFVWFAHSNAENEGDD